MNPRRKRVLKALANVGPGTARDVWRRMRGPNRGDVRGVAQTLRRAADDGLVTAAGEPGKYTWSLSDAGRELLA